MLSIIIAIVIRRRRRVQVVIRAEGKRILSRVILTTTAAAGQCACLYVEFTRRRKPISPRSKIIRRKNNPNTFEVRVFFAGADGRKPRRRRAYIILTYRYSLRTSCDFHYKNIYPIVFVYSSYRFFSRLANWCRCRCKGIPE